MKILEELVESSDLLSYCFIDGEDKSKRLLLTFPSSKQLEISLFDETNELFVFGTRKCSYCTNNACWSYSPGNDDSIWCNSCVPRSCSCNYSYDEEFENDPDWFLITLTDYDGLEEVCCEYHYAADGLL